MLRLGDVEGGFRSIDADAIQNVFLDDFSQLKIGSPKALKRVLQFGKTHVERRECKCRNCN